MKKKTEPYIITKVKYLQALGPLTGLLFSYIEGLCDAGITFTSSDAAISRTLGCSEKTIERAIAKLKALNYIIVERNTIPVGVTFYTTRIIVALPEEQRLTVDENLEEAI